MEYGNWRAGGRLTNIGKINALAWHPSEARLALRCELTGPWIKELANPHYPLAREPVTATRVIFSPD